MFLLTPQMSEFWRFHIRLYHGLPAKVHGLFDAFHVC